MNTNTNNSRATGWLHSSRFWVASAVAIIMVAAVIGTAMKYTTVVAGVAIGFIVGYITGRIHVIIRNRQRNKKMRNAA
ncbi:MAG: hypothetical protein OXI96_07655 [Acidimicrobiaceae bacterium]|nr:hypothetical protein [Acidimicrobiaceae bacterium]